MSGNNGLFEVHRALLRYYRGYALNVCLMLIIIYKKKYCIVKKFVVFHVLYDGNVFILVLQEIIYVITKLYRIFFLFLSFKGCYITVRNQIRVFREVEFGIKTKF